MSDAGREPEVEYCSPPDWPLPAGHYSPAAAFGDLVFVSGQLPVVPGGSSFEAQVRNAIERLFTALKSAGSEPSDIVKLTAYIVGVENWAAFNATYAAMMGENRPARAVVPVPELHHGCLVEVEAIAVRRGPRPGTD